MLRFHFLGTCSGTEPFENMHHCSWVLNVNGKNYWFDAGENCAHRAYCDGIEIMDTAALFISHPHIDHIGGLANLLACFEKLENRYKKQLICDNTLKIYCPSLSVLAAIKTVAMSGETSCGFSFKTEEHDVCDGLLFEDERVRVSAIHNAHLKEDGTNGWHSYSYLIETEGKKIVFSGDVKNPQELDTLIGESCDMLIMETGHHSVEDVLEYAVLHNVKKLRFNHHGRSILEDRARAVRLAEECSEKHGIDVKICYDGMTEILQ